MANTEWDRIQTYIDQMDDFLKQEGNKHFLETYRDFRVTLVCDDLNLTGAQRQAYRSLSTTPRFEHVTWGTFLARTRQTHQEFLVEADRQRKLALRP